MLKYMRKLEMTTTALELARDLATALALPAKALDDAFHIAIATVHRAHFLATWNFTQMNNEHLLPRTREVCRIHGFECPVFCTPEELMAL